jgi:hypothetical protein
MYEFLIQTNIPIFHHSIIPSGLHETCSTRNGVISISCTISETFGQELVREGLGYGAQGRQECFACGGQG